jgi:hypothetical protein
VVFYKTRIKLDINAPVLSSRVLVLHILKLDRAQRRTTTPKIIRTRRESRSERFCTVPVRSFVRRFSRVSFLFSFDARLTIVFCCAVVLFFARLERRKKLKCLVPQFYAQFYTNHTQSTHGTFSFSLSLSLSVSSTDEDAFFLGFLAGEIVQSLTRARTRRRSVRVIFGFALRAFATFFSLSSVALKFEDFIYTARASSALA